MNALSLGSWVKAGGDVVFRDLDGETVLLDLRGGVYFGLDGVGARIWQLLQRPTSLRAVRDVLVKQQFARAEVEDPEPLRGRGLRKVDHRQGARIVRIAARHCRRNFGNIADLVREVRRKLVHVVGKVAP